MYQKFLACYKTTKETYQLLPSINKHTALKQQSQNLIRKNIKNFTTADFKENTGIVGILKADLHS